MLSYHFYPSNEIGARRVTALARYLADNGVRVVILSTFGGKQTQPGSEIIPGVVAIPVAPSRKGSLAVLVMLKRRMSGRRNAEPNGRLAGVGQLGVRSRLWRWAGKIRELYFRFAYFVDEDKSWGWRASRAAVRACGKYDANLIIASGPPHSALLGGARAARKLGIPFVADLRDPWSDSIAAGYPNRRIELRLLRVLERWVMRGAAAVTSTSGAVATLLEGRNKNLRGRIQVIRNGYDGGVMPAQTQTGGRLVILFAGELYLGRNPFPLLSGIEWLLGRPEVDATRIEVTFMGKVHVYSGQSLVTWMEGKRCASVVRILPPQSPQMVAAAVMRSTVLLNLAQQQPLSVPAKTFEQLASGREILLLCENNCETARLVSGIGGITQVDPANFSALTNALLGLYTRHVVKGNLTAPAAGDVSQFSRVAANEAFYSVLASVAPLGPPLVARAEPAAGLTQDL